MPTQYRFPLHPAGAQEVNEVLAIHQEKGQVAYFAAGVPVFTHAADDQLGRRFAAVQLVELGLAEQTELAPALGLHRTTIHRCRRKVRAAGVGGLVAARPGPKGRHKLTAPRLQQAQAQLDAGASIRAAAADVGVRESTLRHALQRGDLHRRAIIRQKSFEGGRIGLVRDGKRNLRPAAEIHVKQQVIRCSGPDEINNREYQ